MKKEMKEMNRYVKLGVAFGVLLGLIYIWPNLIHEPLHYLALRVQGADGHINYDWSFPSHPSITRLGSVQGVLGGLLYLMLPSVVSIMLLGVIWATKKRATILTHIVLPAYLTFDLVLNIWKYGNQQSDFHYLTVLPITVFIVLLLGSMIFGAYILSRGLNIIQLDKKVI